MNNKKICIFGILFIIITIYLFIKLDNIFTYKSTADEQLFSYYKNKSDLDVLFVGTSQMFNGIIPIQLWKDFGITSYSRAKDAQFYKVSYYIIQEAVRIKKPKIIVMDMLYLSHLQDLASGSKQINWMKISYDKYKGFKDIFPNESFINFFSYNYYHTRWKNLQSIDFYTDLKYVSLGYLIAPRIWWINPIQAFDTSEYTTPLDKLGEDTIIYANKIVELCKKNNISIIFVKFPQTLNTLIESRNNLFDDFCKKNNYNFIDFNKLIDVIGIDFTKDFYDGYHLNRYGAEKITSYMGNYLINNFNIADKRNMIEYKDWNKEYEVYKRVINKETLSRLKSFQEWQNLVFYDNYTVMLSINGDILKNLPETLKNDLKSFGLKKYNTNKANMRYAAIIDDNKVFFEEISNKPVTYKGRMKNIVNLLVSSDGKATINVSGKPRSKNKYGLNFVIYDKVNREIVDSIWIDPANFNQVRR